MGGVGGLGGRAEAGKTQVTDSRTVLEAMLRKRLSGGASEWLEAATGEIRKGASGLRFANLISLTSRFAPRRGLEPDAREAASAWETLPGWSLGGWTVLEATRVSLILAHPDPYGAAFLEAFEECFRFADEGELCALYRSLAHLPAGERFVWRAEEGCRTNMGTVFEAVACDTPYPARFFDDLAWRQLLVKALFVGAPLWRVYGLDERLSPELARMALDLADERRSAGRAVPSDLWLCLGPFGGARGVESLEREVRSSHPRGRCAAVLALSRAGCTNRLEALLEEETDRAVARTLREALNGKCDQYAFRKLPPEES